LSSIEEFRSRCERWFDANYHRRAAVARSELSWGEGPDNVSLFEEDDPDVGVRDIVAARAWRAALASADLAWITGPREYGGLELTIAHQRAFDDVMRAHDVPGNRLLMVSLGMVAPTILAHGSTSAKDRYLKALHDGRLVACQLFSEPGAGSDLASVNCRAEPAGAGWSLTGQKVWTSGAHFSDIGLALCRTSDGPRHRNLTVFVVDMHAPGVEVRPLRQMTGGVAFNEVFLDNVWVPDADRVGEIDAGWHVAMTTLSNERAAIGGDGFGGSGLLSADRYRELVRALGEANDPIVRQQLVSLYMELRVARLTSLRATANRRAGRPGPEGSFGKLALTRNYQRITKFVSQVLGPSLIADTGEWGTFAWSSFVTGVPGMRIGGGTDEVLLNAIAERQLGLPKEPRP
jgi:alkylation response protein AidB-like acyl-CoA dehydrogenase